MKPIVAAFFFAALSLGSGFIASADGFILTKARVLDSADEILVRLTDKREYKAKTIGAEKRTDVALLVGRGDLLTVVSTSGLSEGRAD